MAGSYHAVSAVPIANHYHVLSARMANRYASRVNPAVTPPSQWSWLTTEKVVCAMAAIIVGLFAVAYVNLRSDVADLKTDTREITRQLNQTRVEIVKALGAVERQAATTNARLDQLIADGARQRR